MLSLRKTARGAGLIAVSAISAMACLSAWSLDAKAATAYALEPLPDKIDYHDFVVGPGKIELTLSPGQSQTVELTVANRLGSDKTFSISEEDFKGSDDPNQPVVLLGSDRGPYSLKDDIHIPAATVDIPFGDRARIPITVTVPPDAQPGALYGSVLVSVVSSPGTTTADTSVQASNPIVTRIGTLFFVRVPGPVQAGGQLSGFSLAGGSVVWDSSLTGSPPVSFDLLFKNDGDVYLTPQGKITVTNIFGSNVGDISVDPWFAMPQSLRFRQVEWKPAFMFGRYTATAVISRGYDNATDTAEVTFWVIPWTLLLIAFIGIVILVLIGRWIAGNFRISRKK